MDFYRVEFIGRSSSIPYDWGFRLGEVALISPFKYSSLLWATLIGLVVWNDLPSKHVVLGAFILILSGIYLLRNEVTSGGENR